MLFIEVNECEHDILMAILTIRMKHKKFFFYYYCCYNNNFTVGDFLKYLYLSPPPQMSQSQYRKSFTHSAGCWLYSFIKVKLLRAFNFAGKPLPCSNYMNCIFKATITKAMRLQDHCCNNFGHAAISIHCFP